MNTSILKTITILAILSQTIVTTLPEKNTFEAGSLKFSHEFTATGIEIKLEIPFAEMKQSLALQFMTTTTTECPSMVLYWDKQAQNSPSLSVAAGCKAGEKEPVMRWELVGDWERIQDEVKGGVFLFHGKKSFKGLETEEGLKDFGFGSFKQAKYVSDKGKRSTFTGELK